MIYRDFQGLKLSGLGLGMMRLPVLDGDGAKIDEATVAEMVDYAIKNGINYFDTAWAYHEGNSELVAGKVLSQYPRDSYYLATKFPGYDKANVTKAAEIFEKQLEKCQTDYFDFYLLHNVTERDVDDYLDPDLGICQYFVEQKKNGRIKHLGFSAHGTLDTLKRFLAVHGDSMEFCQLQLNYMDWHFQLAEEKYKLMKEHGIDVWIMEPLRGGKLAVVSEQVEAELKKMRPDETVPAWAFRFLQSLPEVKMVLSGMSNMEQLKANVETFAEDKPLTKVEFDKLIATIDAEIDRIGAPCTACRYCTAHCPKGLPIPEIIHEYNEYKISGVQNAANAIARMPEDKRPATCVGCRSCEKVCPQNIKISEIMKEFSEAIGM